MNNENETQKPYDEMYSVNQKNTKNDTPGLAIASLVLGIVGNIINYYQNGAIFAVLGLIFGIIILSKKNCEKGVAIAGVVTSSVAIAVTIGFITYSFNMFT